MQNSFRLLKIKGISIEAHWSWLLIFGLVIYSLASSLFPATYPGLSVNTYWSIAVIAAVLLFASIVLHELGHSFRAVREGMHIEGVTLWLFGGVARFSGMFPSAGAEFRIAIAGPLVSVVLAVVFIGLRALFDALGVGSAAVAVVDYLARINSIVVAFNLIPALPLDGGRILRAALWSRQKDFAAATESAARAGAGFGGLLAFIGIVNLLFGQDTGGLWLVLVGWFLMRAAEAEARFGVMQRALSGRSAADLMMRRPDTVAPDVSLQHFLTNIVRPRGHALYPVVADGRVFGVVDVAEAARVPASTRPSVRVADVMLAPGAVATIGVDTAATDAAEAVRRSPRQRVLVEDNGEVVGMLSSADIARATQLEAALAAGKPRARRAGFVIWVPVLLVMALAAAALYHPPVVVFAPGVTADISDGITISGTPTDVNMGRYLLTSVRLERPTALGALWAGVALDRQVVPLSRVVPRGVTTEDYLDDQREVFRESRMIAAAAAARAAGMNVTVDGTGVIVRRILPGSPADGVLQEGDVIVAVEGAPVDLATNLQQKVRELPAGTPVGMTVDRRSSRIDVTARTAQLPELPEAQVGLGVVVETRDLVVDLPFEITFEERAIGGPSAGFAYAVAIADMLQERDYTRGAVGISGTIDTAGSVGPVGGLDAKAEVLEDAGAHLFLVDDGQVNEIEPRPGLQVRGVASLARALSVLKASARGST